MGAGIVAKQEIVDGGARKLGRGTEAAEPGIECPAEGEETAIEQSRVEDSGPRASRGDGHCLPKLFDHACSGIENLIALGIPGTGNLRQNRTETGMAPPVLRRKVSAAEERLQIGSEPHRHGPATAARSGLNKRHVDAVDLGAFFAID